MVAALLALALAQHGSHGYPTQANLGPAKRNLPAYLEFAPPSGAGLPVAQDLCDQVTAAEADGGFCLKSDGTNAYAAGTGALVMAEIGSNDGGVSSQTVCPSGSLCATKSVILYTEPASGAVGKWGHEAQVATAQPSGAVCACWLGTLSNAGIEQNLLSQTENGGAISTLWQSNTTGTSVVIYNGASPDRTITGLAPDVYHLVCTDTADGTTGQAYLDGAAIGATYTATLSAVMQHWRVSGYGNGAFPLGFSSRTRGAFVLNGTSCGSTRITAIARAVLADAPTSTKGIALSCTRASASSCPQPYDTEASVTDLPANRCCIAGGPAGTGALARHGAYTEKLLRTSELDNAAWTSVGTPTMSANSTIAPNGTLTADTLGDDDGAAFEGKTQDVTVTSAAATRLSVYAKAGAGTKLRLSNDGTTCDFTVTSTWARYKCDDASASGTSTTQQVLVGNVVGDTGNVIVWRANLTQTDRLMPGVDATSAAVNVAATNTSFANALAAPNPSNWCMGTKFWMPGAASGVDYGDLLAIGVYSSTNSAKLQFNGTTGWPRFDFKGALGVQTTSYYTSPVFAAETVYDIAGCAEIGVEQSMWLNGTKKTLDGLGVPLTAVVQPSTFYLGCDSSGLFPNSGWFWDVRLWNRLRSPP